MTNDATSAVCGVLAVLLLAGFAAYAMRSIRREADKSALTVARAVANPGSLAYLGLMDANPVTLTIAFKDEQKKVLGGISGVNAVRVFDRLKVLAPNAVAETWPARENVLSSKSR